jgi:hypothetical protein
MKCSICNKPIVLVPSAAYRAKTYGGSPSDYAQLFTVHADCQIAKNKADVSNLIKRCYS